MTTDLNIEASSTNGSSTHSNKSVGPYPHDAEAEPVAGGQGPVTEEGKLASSRNALKHGMLSECLLIPGESPDAFHALAAGLFEEFHPLGPTEEDLVEIMAAARWRRLRVWSMEKTCLSIRMKKEYCEAPEPPPNAEETAGIAFASLANDTRTLDLLNRYESRYDRQYFRAHRRLLEIQEQKLRNEPDHTPPPACGPQLVPDAPIAPPAPADSAGSGSSMPLDPAVSMGNSSISAKRTRNFPRPSHWLHPFTPLENFSNLRARCPLQSDSPKMAAVFQAASGIPQS